MQSITERVAAAATTNIVGTFFRHAAPGRDAFAGGTNGRWGANFPVIYLGRPEESIIVEAYRHLVEEAGVPARLVKPRIEYTVTVNAEHILDLTDPTAVEAVGLLEADLRSEVDNYDACQAVAAAAHQLKYHGVLAPSASGLGETLALFPERLSRAEMPVPVRQDLWERLPADPRRPRAVVTQAHGSAP
jgi:RES domain-containing protein